MTVKSPVAVEYDYEADYLDGEEWKSLPVEMINPSVDADRVPYVTVSMTLAPIDEALFAALDPREIDPAKVGQVRWRIRQRDLAGTVLGYLPRVAHDADDYAIMHVRDITRTLDNVTLTLHSAESLVDDKMCLLKSDGPSPNAPLRTMINWVLELTIGRRRPGRDIPERVIAADEHAQTVIDTGHGWFNRGDSRIYFGDSYLRRVETELNSHNVRLVDLWGLGWYAATRGLPPTYEGAPAVVKLGTYTTDSRNTLPEDVDPIIFDLQQTVNRAGDWADAVVLSGQTGDGLYVESWRQFAGRGDFSFNGWAPSEEAVAAIDAHTKGRAIDVDALQPSGNLAQSIAGRALSRGHDITVTARARFDVLPGMTLEVHMRDIVLTSTIVGLDWNPSDGIMFIRSQSVTASPPLSADVESAVPTATPVAQAISAQREAVDAKVDPAIRELNSLVSSLDPMRWISADLRGRRL